MLIPYRKNTYGPPQPVTGIALLSYIEMMFIPHRKQEYFGTAFYGYSLTFLYEELCLLGCYAVWLL
jgi:hypothetical protein